MNNIPCRPGKGIHGIGLLLLLIFNPLQANDQLTMEFQPPLLSIQAVNTPLPAILKQLQQQTGIHYRLSGNLHSERRTLTLHRQSLTTALETLLAPYNHTIVHHNGQPWRIIILGPRRLPTTTEDRPPPIDYSIPPPVIIPRKNGHYSARGIINGHPVELLVDTGATLVTIPGNIADAIGLSYDRRHPVNTANGRSTGFTTRLDKISLANLTQYNLPALILPTMKQQRILLGMNFLSHYQWRHQDGRLILTPYP